MLFLQKVKSNKYMEEEAAAATLEADELVERRGERRRGKRKEGQLLDVGHKTFFNAQRVVGQHNEGVVNVSMPLSGKLMFTHKATEGVRERGR